MYEYTSGPTGPIGHEGPIGATGDPGRPGQAGRSYPIIEQYPHGWAESSHAGIRGSWGADCETELLEHLIYWLDRCREPVLYDPAGNAYCGVDSNVVKQTLELLRRYERLLTQPLCKQLAGFCRDVCKTADGPQGPY